MNKLYSTFSKSHKNRFERQPLAGLCTKICFMKECLSKIISNIFGIASYHHNNIFFTKCSTSGNSVF